METRESCLAYFRTCVFVVYAIFGYIVDDKSFHVGGPTIYAARKVLERIQRELPRLTWSHRTAPHLTGFLFSLYVRFAMRHTIPYRIYFSRSFLYLISSRSFDISHQIDKKRNELLYVLRFDNENDRFYSFKAIDTYTYVNL